MFEHMARESGTVETKIKEPSFAREELERAGLLEPDSASLIRRREPTGRLIC